MFLKILPVTLNDDYERDLNEIRDFASQNIQKLQYYNKGQYGKRSKLNTRYCEGDLVSIRSVKQPGERSKLKPKFKGPYVVKKVLDRNRYVISDIDGFQISGRRFEGVFDPSNMRLYQRDNDKEIANFSDSRRY